MSKLKVCSLFSGIGGFEMGLYDALGKENVEIVFSSEIDKYASKSYSLIHGHIPFGDITKIHEEDIPDHDLLVGGFPCQAFSIAGKRKGFDDTRGTLFFEVARIIRAKQPQFFILENVKGLLSHDKGNTFKTIKETLNELGYTYHFQVLNSKYFGVPQNRERIFIVGSLNDERILDFVFPEQKEVSKCIKDILEENVDKKFYLKEEQVKKFVPKPSNNDIKKAGYLESGFDSNGRIYNPEGIAPTIGVSSSDETKIIIEGYAGDYAHSGSLVMGTEGISKCILGGNPSKYILEKPFKIRRLTPLECFRLQGFKDEYYHLLKENGISNTQLYKMAGNAVTSNVISAIVKNLFKEMK